MINISDRSPEGILNYFNQSKETWFNVLSLQTYQSTKLNEQIQILRKSFHLVFNEDGQIKGHKRCSEENRSGEDWYKQSWHRGFWTRRHDEGNHKTVYKVLSDIFYHYDKVKKDTLLNNSIIIGKDTCLKSDFVQTYELGACVVTGHYTHNHLTDEAFTGKLFEDEDSTYCINEYKDGEETGITCYYKGGELLRNGNQWFYKNGNPFLQNVLSYYGNVWTEIELYSIAGDTSIAFYPNGDTAHIFYENEYWGSDPNYRYFKKSYYEGGKLKSSMILDIEKFTKDPYGVNVFYKKWHQSGQLMQSGQYSQWWDEPAKHGFTKQGKWSDYDLDGQVIIEEHYEDHKLRLTKIQYDTKYEDLLTSKNTSTLIIGSDPCQYINYRNDSVIYIYKDYKIRSKPMQSSNGNLIKVYDKKSQLLFRVIDGFFMGIKDKCMIIDEGTGSLRDLKIYDIKKSEIVFENSYVNELKLINGNLHYSTKVELDEESKKPECPKELLQLGEESIGYIEKHIYDLKKRSLNKTGQYSCQYFE